jgi:hypothetical protein
MAHWFFTHEYLSRVVGVTLGVTGLFWYATKKLRSFIVGHGKTIINGSFWLLERIVTKSISAKLSMYRYCAAQLSEESGRFLQVPAPEAWP